MATVIETTAPANKGGAPRGNTNNWRTGKRSDRTLTLGKLPPGCAWIRRLVTMFRNKIEQAAVEANHGPLSVYQQASVQTAARYEMVALLATRWLRVGDDKLTPDQRLTHATTIAKSSELRDKALQRAGLDRKGRQQALDALYGEVEDEADESHAEGHDTDKGTQSDGNSPEPSAGIPAENGE